MLYSNRTMIK